MNKVRICRGTSTAARVFSLVVLLSIIAHAMPSVNQDPSRATSYKNLDDCSAFRAQIDTLQTEDLPRNASHIRYDISELDKWNKLHTAAIKALAAAQLSDDKQKIRAAKARADNANDFVGRSKSRLDSDIAEGKRLNAQLARLQARLKTECASEMKIPDLRGQWNTPYGVATITQSGPSVYILVRYDKGGTSSIEGTFARENYITYTWRNTVKEHGTGGLTYYPDSGHMNGYWLDKSQTPFKKGDWWLRPK